MVKFFSIFLAVLFISSGITALENSDDPLRIISTEGHFSVTFPAGFSHAAKEEESVETELGLISTVNYVSFNDTSVAMAGAGSYPDSVAASMNSEHEQLFTLAKESLMVSLSATVIKSHNLTDSEFPASETEFTTQMEDIVLVGKARFIFDGKRLYSIIFITSDPQTLTTHEIKDFFNSFVINHSV